MLPPNWQADFAESLCSHTPSPEGVQPLVRLHIYQHNHHHTLIQTLKKHYPLIANLCGPDFFNAACKAYLEQYPSGSSSLTDYGAYFSNFLSEYEPADHLIYLPELAHFEWACHQVETAADASALSLPERDLLRTENKASLTLGLNPASQLMKCHYPIKKIMQWCQRSLTQDTSLDEDSSTLLIHRINHELSFTSLSVADFIFLNRLQEGYVLADAIAQTEMLAPLYPFDEKLNDFIESGLIVEVNVQ